MDLCTFIAGTLAIVFYRKGNGVEQTMTVVNTFRAGNQP